MEHGAHRRGTVSHTTALSEQKWGKLLTFSLSISGGSSKPFAVTNTQLDRNFMFLISLLPRASIASFASAFSLGQKRKHEKASCEGV